MNTALADDPDLTCRIPGLETHSPLRGWCSVPARLRLNERSKLAATARKLADVLVFTAVEGGGKLAAAGVQRW